MVLVAISVQDVAVSSTSRDRPITQSLALFALSMGQIVGHCQFLSSKPASSHDEQLSIECILLSAAKTVAFTALLHGDADEYFIYALVLAGQLRRYSHNADRVLLLGPGVFRESLESRKALILAGWTHLLSVEAIHTPHLDKTGSKRHRYVFTKLHALELPYKHIVFLDLDLLPRNDTDLTSLFDVKAPAGKYHGYTAVGLEHAKLVPQEDRNGFWCINAGVLRLDPKTTAEDRRFDLSVILMDLMRNDKLEPTYLPEQYYLAQRLHGWHHICRSYNHEVGLEGMPSDSAVRPPDQLCDIPSKVWHYSGKCGMQPWMFLDFHETSEIKEWLGKHYYSLDSGGIVAISFSEWFAALQVLRKEPHGIAGIRNVIESLDRLAERSESERRWCDSFRVQALARQQAELEPSLKGQCRHWEYQGRDIAFDFVAFAVYERHRHHLEPGPRGDEEALARAAESWIKSNPVQDTIIEDKCSQCKKLDTCYQGQDEFASMKYCQSCWQKWCEVDEGGSKADSRDSPRRS